MKRVTTTNTSKPAMVFYNYDHLGNTRITYTCKVDYVIGTTTKKEYTAISLFDYDPYGKVLRSYGNTRYLTTYHERNVETGLDYRGARFYDGETYRFLSLDPLQAKYPSLSAYNYVAGNPVYFVDPSGKTIEVWETEKDENGETKRDKNGNAVYKLVHTYKPNEGYSGSNESVQRIVEALDDAYNNSQTMKNVIDFMVENDATAGITEGKANRTLDRNDRNSSNQDGYVKGSKWTFGDKEYEGTGKPSNSIISWDPTGTEGASDGTNTRHPIIGLVHELIHAARLMMGVQDNTPMASGLPFEEYMTSVIENMVRAEYISPKVGSTPLRATYEHQGEFYNVMPKSNFNWYLQGYTPVETTKVPSSQKSYHDNK